MVINVVAKDQSDVKKIVKPIYWKYPALKWVSFRELRDFHKSRFADMLREAAITIVVDEDSSFCYSAVEAMKSGSILLCKVPNTELEWMQTEDGTLPNCCVWFDNYDTLHKQIASVVRSWVTDKVPDILSQEAKKVYSKFSEERTKKEFLDYLNSVLKKRKKEMEELMTHVKNNSDK